MVALGLASRFGCLELCDDMAPRWFVYLEFRDYICSLTDF